jgi:general secretion pathway protein D
MVALAPAHVTVAGGKKHFKQGVKHENAERWEAAAEAFALALTEEPANPEYRLHYSRALANASLLLTARGDDLAADKDYAAAYQAYRQAYNYDSSNELALAKMKHMLRIQGLEEEPPGPESTLLKASYRRNTTATLQIPAQNRVKTDVMFRDAPIGAVIASLADSIGLNVIYDDLVRQADREKKIDVDLKGITKAKALELVLLTNKLFYVQADSRTLIVAPDSAQNRTRYQNLAVRTFYVRNAELNEVRSLVQSIVGTKQVVTSKNLNALTVRDTPNNIELIESLIASIDKDRAEVLIDVNFYEVQHADLLRLGNQFNVEITKPGSLATFIGGVGVADKIRPNVATGLFGPIGLALGVPTSELSLFQDKSRSKLIAAAQVHVLDSESHTVRIGQRVPIQTASIPTQSTVVTGDGNPKPGTQPTQFQTGVQQFQYENVGLNIDLTPYVREDMVQMKMKVETSDVVEQNSGVGGNPVFTQRSMSSVASIRDGQTTLIAGVASMNRNDGVRGLPLVSLIPWFGRLFATPTQNSRLIDVVITVTPHILRAPVYGPEDSTPIASGTVTTTDRQLSIEEIVYRAELDEAAAATAPPVARAAERPRTTELTFGGESAAGVEMRPVRSQGPMITTPKGPARLPVVESEPPSSASGPTSGPTESVEGDDEGEDEGEEEEEPPPAGQAVLRLMGLNVASMSKPLNVSVYAFGGSRPSSVSLALRFDPALVTLAHVDSSGILDGRIGGRVPFEVRDGVATITVTRPENLAGKPLTGQIITFVFNVVAAGEANFELAPEGTQLLSGTAPVPFSVAGPITVSIK